MCANPANTQKLGWAVYLVKGVICERDVYSILDVTITNHVSECYLDYLYVLVY